VRTRSLARLLGTYSTRKMLKGEFFVDGASGGADDATKR